MLRLDINVLWIIINLLIIYAIVRKFLFQPVRKILEARQAEIDKQYAEAQAAQDKAEELKRQYQESLSSTADERAVIVGEAREKASAEYEKIVGDAKEQAEKIVSEAQKSASLEQEKRIRQAQEQIADLVVAATAKLVAVKQNAEADRELYNQFIAKTGENCD